MISIVHTMPDYWGDLKMGLPRAYGIDAVRERHAGHRGAGLGALGQDLLLEFGAVAPTGLGLGFSHGVHLSRLVDTIVAAYAAFYTL